MEANSVKPISDRFFDILDLCCRQIEKKMGGKPIAEWRSSDYNTLSCQLGKQTKVYLSENTLKRIFGKLKTSTRYYPQKATRDALAQFIGFRDWHEFELINRFAPVEVPSVQEEQQTNQPAPPEIIKFNSSLSAMLISAILLIVIGLGTFFIVSKKNIKPGEVRLICENPIGQVPHTAVFKLTAQDEMNLKERFTIDFMDEGPAKDITGDMEVAQFFKNPGVNYIRLLFNGKPIDTVTVAMQTKGWVANSGNDSLNAYPVAKLQPLPEKRIYVTASQLDSAGLTLSKPFVLGFSNIHSSTISGDNFEFSSYLKTEESRPGVACMQAGIVVQGSISRHKVFLFKPSCAAFSEYEFSESKIKGVAKYLGTMGYDFYAGGNVRLLVRNKKVSLFINGKNILNSQYNQSIGKVLGVKIIFNSIGIAKFPKLYDLKTKVVY